MNIGAGNIQLIGRNSLSLVEPFDNLDVFDHRVAEHVDDDLAARIALHGRQFPLQVVLDAHILQSDGVEHARRCLHNARRGMTGHWLERDSLGNESTDPIQRDNLFKFNAVAEGAAGGEDGVGQFETGQRHSHVGFHLAAFFLLFILFRRGTWKATCNYRRGATHGFL